MLTRRLPRRKQNSTEKKKETQLHRTVSMGILPLFLKALQLALLLFVVDSTLPDASQTDTNDLARFNDCKRSYAGGSQTIDDLIRCVIEINCVAKTSIDEINVNNVESNQDQDNHHETAPIRSYSWKYNNNEYNTDVLLEDSTTNIWKINNFITEDECSIIVDKARGDINNLKQYDTSITKDSFNITSPSILSSYSHIDDDDKISKFIGDATIFTSSKLTNLYNRVYSAINEQTGYNVKYHEGQEEISVMNYKTGYEYKLHCDGICRHTNNNDNEIPVPKYGRIATVMMVCQSPRSGGSTFFPYSNIHINSNNINHSKLGIFVSYKNNMTNMMDTKQNSAYQEKPVVHGNKWIVTMYIRNNISSTTIKSTNEKIYHIYDKYGKNKYVMNHMIRRISSLDDNNMKNSNRNTGHSRINNGTVSNIITEGYQIGPLRYEYDTNLFRYRFALDNITMSTWYENTCKASNYVENIIDIVQSYDYFIGRKVLLVGLGGGSMALKLSKTHQITVLEKDLLIINTSPLFYKNMEKCGYYNGPEIPIRILHCNANNYTQVSNMLHDEKFDIIITDIQSIYMGLNYNFLLHAHQYMTGSGSILLARTWMNHRIMNELPHWNMIAVTSVENNLNNYIYELHLKDNVATTSAIVSINDNENSSTDDIIIPNAIENAKLMRQFRLGTKLKDSHYMYQIIFDSHEFFVFSDSNGNYHASMRYIDSNHNEKTSNMGAWYSHTCEVGRYAEKIIEIIDLYVPYNSSILNIGLGGGALGVKLTKYFQVTTLENNMVVLSSSSKFWKHMKNCNYNGEDMRVVYGDAYDPPYNIFNENKITLSHNEDSAVVDEVDKYDVLIYDIQHVYSEGNFTSLELADTLTKSGEYDDTTIHTNSKKSSMIITWTFNDYSSKIGENLPNWKLTKTFSLISRNMFFYILHRKNNVDGRNIDDIDVDDSQGNGHDTMHAEL